MKSYIHIRKTSRNLHKIASHQSKSNKYFTVRKNGQYCCSRKLYLTNLPVVFKGSQEQADMGNTGYVASVDFKTILQHSFP